MPRARQPVAADCHQQHQRKHQVVGRVGIGETEAQQARARQRRDATRAASPRIKVHEHARDDQPERHGHNRQVIAAQARSQRAIHHAENTGDQHAHAQYKQKIKPGRQVSV